VLVKAAVKHSRQTQSAGGLALTSLAAAMSQSSPSVPEYIYHIAMPQHWAAAQATGVYSMSTRDATIADEGYMHASFEHQVCGTLQRFYAEVAAALILVLDTRRIAGAGLTVVVEQLGGAPEPFPHVYGNVPLGAIVRVRSLDEWNSGHH
jgi:uncharacterized protein (DUF952 family)